MNGAWVKCSKQQLRQPDECLCFHCNLPGHLKRNCPKIPYCPKCRTKGHAPDRCVNKPQKTRHTHPAGKPRDQWKNKNDLPQFSSHHNKCLQCAGDHQTANCMQPQPSSTNTSTTGTGIPPHQNAPSTSRMSAHTNSHSPATNSESTYHVPTPTLNITAPPFPPNFHQAPLPLHAPNRPNNFYNNSQYTSTPPHNFNTQPPPSFNPSAKFPTIPGDC